jgi:hypothetical protein
MNITNIKHIEGLHIFIMILESVPNKNVGLFKILSKICYRLRLRLQK